MRRSQQQQQRASGQWKGCDAALALALVHSLGPSDASREGFAAAAVAAAAVRDTGGCANRTILLGSGREVVALVRLPVHVQCSQQRQVESVFAVIKRPNR
jgi:hypothetical protein